jgi:ferric-dicitrate binding protein FerR (iron transport regulator)
MDNEQKDDVASVVRLAGRRPAVPEELARRVKANVRDAWRTEVDARRTRRRFLVALPLAAAAAIAAVVFFMRPPATRPVAPLAPIQVASVERVVGATTLTGGQKIFTAGDIATGTGRVALRTNDGTSVRVDEQTHLRFDSSNSITLLSGTIYLDTARSGYRITTPFGVVRDVGTKFEVRVTPASARVRVREGEVVIGDRSAHRGEQLEASKGGALAVSRIATWGDDWGWLNDIAPAFAVDGKRVAEFLDWVSSESGMEVRYENGATAQKAANVVLHGSIGPLRPVAAADSVLPTAGLRGDVKDGVMTVRAR